LNTVRASRKQRSSETIVVLNLVGGIQRDPVTWLIQWNTITKINVRNNSGQIQLGFSLMTVLVNSSIENTAPQFRANIGRKTDTRRVLIFFAGR
jgi:hypothetical protein